MSFRAADENGSGQRALRFLILSGLLPVSACATYPRLPVQADHYALAVSLDPSTHRLKGRASIDLVIPDEFGKSGGPVAFDVELHPDLNIRSVSARGAIVMEHRSIPTGNPEGASSGAKRHRVVLRRPAGMFALDVVYEGRLVESVQEGEAPRRIHNFSVQAHIGEDGIYLGHEGHWYPRPVVSEDEPPHGSTYSVTAEPVPGMELVAAGQRDGASTSGLSWSTPYPIDEMVLVGGRHEVHEETRGGRTVRLHLKPEQARHAPGLFAAVWRVLDRYEPLLGPYPMNEYAVVDNFFSSGFAFPGFTLLSSAVIEMGKRAQTTHGYLDHELLHSWWGNGVLVDPRDGNWCEGLAAYGANYYGHVLDGNEEEARRTRRNFCHFLSRLDSSDDKPLGTFDREGGAGRAVGYNQGAMVFHMLARIMGQDRFWAAMRRLHAQYLGRYASWEDIRHVCEEESGQSLELFFAQWIRRGGAPRVAVTRAAFDVENGELTLILSQADPPFALDLPIRITHDDGTLDVTVPLAAVTSQSATVPVEVVPQGVEVDPDYHVYRRVERSEIVPTTATTRGCASLAVVFPEEAYPRAYDEVADVLAGRAGESSAARFTPRTISAGALAERCVLILGDAACDPYVAGFLDAVEFPVRFTDDGFEFAGELYDHEGDAVLCTARHPGVSGGGITVVYANSEPSIPKPGNLPLYDRSLVIFRSANPVIRRDFEPARVIPVER